MIRALALAAVLVSSVASAQIPLVSRLARGPTLSPLPQDADPIDYWAGAFMDQGENCARFTVDGRNWLPCTATVADVAVVRSYAEGLDLTLSGEIATVYGMASGAQSTANSAATAASAAQTTANSASTAAGNAATAAASAQTTATNAGAAAATAQTTANAAQSAAATNATAIAALVTRVGAAEGLIAAQAAAISTLQSQVSALQANLSPFRFGTAVASGLSIPLLGLQTAPVTSTIAGAQVGAFCEVQSIGFAALGASGVCEITAPNIATTRWVSNAGPLSGILNIPNGSYPLRVGKLP